MKTKLWLVLLVGLLTGCSTCKLQPKLVTPDVNGETTVVRVSVFTF